MRNSSHPKRKKQCPAIQETQLCKGTIAYLPLGSEEGLIVTGGYKYRNKYIVIVGFTEDGFIVGSLLINTKAHDATPELGACQFPLEQKDYPGILEYKSWLDCSRLFRIEKNKMLKNAQFCGTMTEKDSSLLFSYLHESTMLSNREKKEFGL